MKLSLLFCVFLSLFTAPLIAQVKLSSSTFGQIEARSIGAAVMGGRITAIEGVNSSPKNLYVGTAGGGVWKSTTAGMVFEPVFDKYAQSIGAIAIDQVHPDTVWVGTGESNMRNSVAIGTGIFRSTDGGRNWSKMGLENSEHIAKIIIHPTNPNVLYVAVPGRLWSDGPDRGLYKTADGGKTWEKILYTNEKTGCADVVMDPMFYWLQPGSFGALLIPSVPADREAPCINQPMAAKPGAKLRRDYPPVNLAELRWPWHQQPLIICWPL